MTETAPATRMRRGGIAVAVGWLALTATVLLAAPVAAMLARTPWSRIVELGTDPAVVAALRLSALTSLLAAGMATVLGVPVAWLLARTELPGRGALRILALLPLVLPPVVAGTGLLLAFGRRGLLGGPLAELVGVTLPFSTAGVVVAQAFVALPFVVLSVEAGFRALEPRYEQAAATLGADAWTRFRRVTLPLAGPAVGSGVMLAWARALGEFGATITFAGNLPGETQTMPLAVFLALEQDLDAAILLSVLLLAVSVILLVMLRGRFTAGLAR